MLPEALESLLAHKTFRARKMCPVPFPRMPTIPTGAKPYTKLIEREPPIDSSIKSIAIREMWPESVKWQYLTRVSQSFSPPPSPSIAGRSAVAFPFDVGCDVCVHAHPV